MNIYVNKITKLLLASLVVILFQACSLKVPINSPKVSNNSYEKTDHTLNINLKYESKLNENHNISTGRFANVVILEHNNKKIDASSYIKSALEKELLARNISLNIDAEDINNSLSLDNFEIMVHRASSYSPFITLSTLKITIDIDDEKKTFVSYIKRGKVPIWVMSEIFDPCYNEPITLLVKEIVAKINKHYFDYKLSDENVEKLINKISTQEHTNLTYLDVYELGFSNNSKALEYLKTLTSENSEEYIRLAAISSIGILGDEKELDFLISINEDSRTWQDRAIALKSIGDLNTPESLNYLKQRKKFWQEKTTDEAIWNLDIINLYI